MSIEQNTQIITEQELEQIREFLNKRKVSQGVIESVIRAVSKKFSPPRVKKERTPTTARGLKNQLTRLVKRHDGVVIEPIINQEFRTVSFVLPNNELFAAELKNLLEKTKFNFAI